MADVSGLAIGLMIALPLAAILIVFIICYLWRKADDDTDRRSRTQRRNELLVSANDLAAKDLLQPQQPINASNLTTHNDVGVLYVGSPQQQPQYVQQSPHFVIQQQL